MLGKLLKHEFNATGRILLPVYALAFATAALIGLMGVALRALDMVDDVFSFVVAPLITFGGLAVLGATFTVPFVVIVVRFYRSFLGSEGHLMFTLPVTRHQLILSNLITAFVWYVVTMITVTVAVTIALAGWIPAGFFADNAWYFEALTDPIFGPWRYFDQSAFGWIMSAVSVPLGTISTILMVYFAMALGQLSNSYRIFLSVVIYFGIWLTTTIITVMFTAPVSDPFAMGFGMGDPAQFQQATMIANTISNVLALVFCIVMYFGTEYLLRKRLNLL